MKKKYQRIIYLFFTIFLFSIIGGVVKYSLRYIDDNPDLYIPKTKDWSTCTSEEINKKFFAYKFTSKNFKSILYNFHWLVDFMIRKNIFFVEKENSLKDVKAKHNYQIVEEYWKKRKKEYKKNLSKFC